MMYQSLLSRSFSKHEQKRLKYGGFFTFFLISFSFFTIFKPYLAPLPFLHLRLSIGDGQKLRIVDDTNNSYEQTMSREIANKSEETINKSQPLFKEIIMKSTLMVNHSNFAPPTADDGDMEKRSELTEAVCKLMERSDFCEIKGDIRIDANSSTVFIISSANSTTTQWSIRPYARKGDSAAMRRTREWSVKLVNDQRNTPKCTHNHNVPAVLFSLGGYSGNHFHAFTDIIVPLYSTARPFNGKVQFLVTDKQPWWIAKFKTILKALSRYDIIDVDNRDENVHCFSSITVGLKRKSSKELTIEAAESSMKEFMRFLRSCYSLRKKRAIKILRNGIMKKKPRLLIISRKKSRAFSNVDEIGRMGKRLGYKVVVDEPDGNISRSAQVMNSCDVVLGVHGAGLTNMLFLPENAVLIQVVPFGGAEWVSKTFFEDPSKAMKIRYLEYKISIQESSLIHQYPSDHVVLSNPSVVQKQGWEAFKSIYFDKQNVEIDLNRFRPTLIKALELLGS
ncbi:alpha-1,3-arabinosyltransferase XAT2-like isoform X2 [Mercurialis annua]|uniref:alpha-1,3-arabinosyltransferase XAT2-like isoform X2 n=1 Tax=Mercurialis annua TaxID=3986 RepID=UPI00215FF0A6|nr:alpha-1,3-arabinosyltransferase XAT2-like isoform X2 [Mercurialis annua]